MLSNLDRVKLIIYEKKTNEKYSLDNIIFKIPFRYKLRKNLF